VDPFVSQEVTKGVRYFRLHGRGGYRYKYTDAELDELRARVSADSSHESYVMFNNMSMKADALRFIGE
jgi:uncharacterized protein YecE (DUF72 family)